MKIATMATGGIGGFLAVRLTKAGHAVATIARGRHLDAIRREGLALEGPSGREVVQPWIATNDPADVGVVDAVIFGVKGDDLVDAALATRPMVGPDTVVVPFLNGVEASDRLAGILPAPNVANGVAKVSTTVAGPGVIRQTGEFGAFIFGERDNRPSRRIAALQKAMREAGVQAPETDDIEREVWAKFVLFAAVSGVTAAARCRMRDITETPRLGELFRAVVAETAAIGRALGVAIGPGIEARTWDFARTLPPDMRASTAIDLENGRPLEIDWISGAAARLSERAGVAAPMNAALYALLLPHRKGR